MSVLVRRRDTRLFVLGFKRSGVSMSKSVCQWCSSCFLVQPYESILDGLSKHNENFWDRRSRQDVKVVEPPQTTSTPWRWRRSWCPKRRKTFASWRGYLPRKISLNFVAAKASRLILSECVETDPIRICPDWSYQNISRLILSEYVETDPIRICRDWSYQNISRLILS
jgi:hypothetical protein